MVWRTIWEIYHEALAEWYISGYSTRRAEWNILSHIVCHTILYRYVYHGIGARIQVCLAFFFKNGSGATKVILYLRYTTARHRQFAAGTFKLR